MGIANVRQQSESKVFGFTSGLLAICVFALKHMYGISKIRILH